jgi:hypothetical protein
MGVRTKTSDNSTPHRVGAPWRALVDQGGGYLSIYYSEPLARWPVREITRPGDNKSDPNIETGTYGLFSTCEPTMRNRIVLDGAATIFFLTTQKQRRGRVLSGYYHVGWYTEGTQGAINRDFALLASSMRFIEPISVKDLPKPLVNVCSPAFRTMKPIDAKITAALRGICDGMDNQNIHYVEEVQRIEHFALARSGYAYPSWARVEGFSWAHAKEYYQTDVELSRVPNSSKSKKWRCRECDYVIRSGALLKKCPLCKKMATLVPAEEEA